MSLGRCKESQVGLKLNGTHQLLVYADGLNLFRYNIDTIKKNTEALTHTHKKDYLEVNEEKTIICCLIT
jgi:hypothetical protein